ncbi:MAG: VanZ family protein [Lachnospiraceae bacterium]|nr:VanZ family protein [Lachnospiraceae bacterium]
MVITRFSAQDADTSGSLSFEIAEGIAKFFYSFSEHDASDVLTLAGYFEHPLRKLAHLCEYGVLGLLFAGSFLPVIGEVRENGGKGRSLYLTCIFTVFILAAFDEFHQYFVPGRYASVWDVLLDTFGSALFCYFLYLIKDRKKKR